MPSSSRSPVVSPKPGAARDASPARREPTCWQRLATITTRPPPRCATTWSTPASFGGSARTVASGNPNRPSLPLGVHGHCASRRKPSSPENGARHFLLPSGAKKVGRHKSFQIIGLCLEAPAPSTENGAFAPAKNRQFPPFFSRLLAEHQCFERSSEPDHARECVVRTGRRSSNLGRQPDCPRRSHSRARLEAAPSGPRSHDRGHTTAMFTEECLFFLAHSGRQYRPCCRSGFLA